MSGNTDSVVTRLVDRMFPRMPDFYGLMNEQCDVLVEAMEAFVEYLADGEPEKAKRIRLIEKRGDELKTRNTDILNRAFSTVRPDGETHGYHFPVYDGVMLLHMPDATTLWLEGIPDGSLDPGTWTFTAQKTVFVR